MCRFSRRYRRYRSLQYRISSQILAHLSRQSNNPHRPYRFFACILGLRKSAPICQRGRECSTGTGAHGHAQNDPRCPCGWHVFDSFVGCFVDCTANSRPISHRPCPMHPRRRPMHAPDPQKIYGRYPLSAGPAHNRQSAAIGPRAFPVFSWLTRCRVPSTGCTCPADPTQSPTRRHEGYPNLRQALRKRMLAFWRVRCAHSPVPEYGPGHS